MSTKKVRIYDDYKDCAEIGVEKIHDDTNVNGCTFKVSIEFNPDDYLEPNTFMMYTPKLARQLAENIIAAAQQAEKLDKLVIKYDE